MSFSLTSLNLHIAVAQTATTTWKKKNKKKKKNVAGHHGQKQKDLRASLNAIPTVPLTPACVVLTRRSFNAQASATVGIANITERKEVHRGTMASSTTNTSRHVTPRHIMSRTTYRQISDHPLSTAH
ncbi:hypothetical protein TRVL_07235 [Trypanosoma vivax]|nr:hypothetical protein TRVL_07235 [Trypanosoma vivax]